MKTSGPPVLLVAPPVTFEATFPLGLASLASVLRSQGRAVEGLDLRLDPGALSQRLRRPPAPALVVVETSIRNLRAVRQVLAQVRSAGDVPIAVVGTAAAVHPEAYLQVGQADFAVTGDPENEVPVLLESLDRPGVSRSGVRRSGEAESGKGDPEWLPGDHLPAPDREVFPQQRYQGHDLRRGPARAAIETSRGCRFACLHCPIPARYRGTWRGRDPHAVLDEMARLHREFGVRVFLFEDEQPFGNPGALRSLLDLVRRRLPGVQLQFPNGLRADLLDREAIEALAGAGTRRVALGIESTSPEVRARLGRPLEEGPLQAVLGLLRRHEIRVTGYFLAGLPQGQQPTDPVRAGLDARYDYVHVSVCWPWRTLVETPDAAMRRAARWRAVAYAFAYGDPRRMLRLLGEEDLRADDWPLLLKRLGTWIRSGVHGGGGW